MPWGIALLFIFLNLTFWYRASGPTFDPDLWFRLFKLSPDPGHWLIQISGSDPDLQYQGWYIVFISHASCPMPAGGGCDCNYNCSCYYYLVWESFKWLFLQYYLISFSEIQAVQDAIFPWMIAHPQFDFYEAQSVCLRIVSGWLYLDLLSRPCYRQAFLAAM